MPKLSMIRFLKVKMLGLQTTLYYNICLAGKVHGFFKYVLCYSCYEQ